MSILMVTKRTDNKPLFFFLQAQYVVFKVIFKRKFAENSFFLFKCLLSLQFLFFFCFWRPGEKKKMRKTFDLCFRVCLEVILLSSLTTTFSLLLNFFFWEKNITFKFFQTENKTKIANKRPMSFF